MARLTVVIFIILSLEVGLALTILPWFSPALFGDWGSNYFLLAAARLTGIRNLPQIVGSGWVRGAVSGLGIVNLIVAFWEIAHFRENVAQINTK